MPNRIIKDSIHTSETVDKMTDFQFRLWINLITYVDDFGRGDARPAVIKGTCFPLKERLTLKDIEVALNALAGIGCVGLYEVDGKPYLYLPAWGSHQIIRNKKSKFPPPDNACNQLKSNDCKCPRNPIQSNPNPESESNVVVVERACAREDDSEWVKFVREYGNDIGLFPHSTTERGDMELFYDEFGCEALIEMVHYTARRHPNNPHTYFASVCRSLLGKGIRTAEQVKAAIAERERQRRGGAGFADNCGNTGWEYRGLPGETVV